MISSLSQAGAVQEKVCAIVASIGCVQQQEQQSNDPLIQLLAAIAEHAVLALSRLLKGAAAASPPLVLLSGPVLSALIHVVSGGVKGSALCVVGAGGKGFPRSTGLLDAGWFDVT